MGFSRIVGMLVNLAMLAFLSFTHMIISQPEPEELVIYEEKIDYENISIDEDSEGVETQEIKLAYVNAFDVNFRLNSSKSSGVIKRLNYQDEVQIIDIEGDWYKVRYNGLEGYIKSDYVQYDYPEFPTYKVRIESGEEYKLDEELQYYTYELCRNYGIEEYYELILVQMFVESRYKSDAISVTNDYGLMQINICNHKKLSEDLGITDFLDAKSSIYAGIYIMSDYLAKYDIDSALSKYNTGTAYETTDYSREVDSYMDNLVRL